MRSKTHRSGSPRVRSPAKVAARRRPALAQVGERGKDELATGGIARARCQESGRFRAAAEGAPLALDETGLKDLLLRVRSGEVGVGEAVSKLKGAPFERVGDFATLDTHRVLRIGMPEVIFAQGKTAAQVATIASRLAARGPLLVTRLDPDKAGPTCRAVPGAVYDPVSRTLRKGQMRIPTRGPVGVCCAGTSDIPVCEEAVATLAVMGVEVLRIYDVGVAGLHRLLARRRDLERAVALVVAAGMEGALPSVVGGLVGKPVVGLPTSVGYGASLSGLAPLFAMLNSCSPNVAVVNIDNGFGAGFVSGLMAREST